MKLVYMSAERDRQGFAEKAAAYFADHPKIHSFTDGEIEPGCWFALRWGCGDDCVLVFKLDEHETPILYQQLIRATDTSTAGQP